tara:strand:+ start:76 stop:258 length:183 start_codon:yes stop_codon:yes gene_type:complete
MEHVAESILNYLREKKLISPEEVAYKTGDLIVVENVITKDRRVLESVNLLEGLNKQLLKG